MTIYVAEIEGRGIAAFHADNGAEAERLVRDRVFRDDLMVLASNGLPLWDGVADIQVRQALPGEEAKWRTSRDVRFVPKADEATLCGKRAQLVREPPGCKRMFPGTSGAPRSLLAGFDNLNGRGPENRRSTRATQTKWLQPEVGKSRKQKLCRGYFPNAHSR